MPKKFSLDLEGFRQISLLPHPQPFSHSLRSWEKGAILNILKVIIVITL